MSLEERANYGNSNSNTNTTSIDYSCFKIKELKKKHLSANERCYFLLNKQLNRD